MKPKRFIEAVKELNFPEVLDDADFGRVQALYVEAVDQSADRVLVGFRVRGPVVRIVWAVVEVIPVGLLAKKDASALPPSEEGWEAWDFRLDGLTSCRGPRRNSMTSTMRSQTAWRNRPRLSSLTLAECRGRSSAKPPNSCSSQWWSAFPCSACG